MTRLKKEELFTAVKVTKAIRGIKSAETAGKNVIQPKMFKLA